MLKQKILKICDYIINCGLLAIIFFIPLIFDVSRSSYNFFDLYKAIVFRVVLVFILLSFTAKVFINGRLPYRGDAKIFLLAGLTLASFFISSLFSLRPAESFWGGFFRQQGFYNLFNYWLFFAFLILNVKDFKQIRRIIITVIAAASVVSAYGLIQYFKFDPLIWAESANGRIFSALGQPNFFGHWLAMVLPVSLYALIFMAEKMLARFFAALAVFLQLVCLIFTYSRAAWLGFLGSMFFLIIFWLFYKRFKKIAWCFIGLILTGLILIVGLNIASPVKSGDYGLSLTNRLRSLADFKSGSNKMRLYYLGSAAKEIKQADYLRLFFGYGPEVLADIFMKYYRLDWGVYEAIGSFPDRAHSWPFDQILALGFLGLAANLIFYIYFIYRAAVFFLVKRRLEAHDWLLVFLLVSLTAYSLNNLFSFSLFTVLVYLYLILALSWLVINYHEAPKVLTIRLTVFSKILIWAALGFTSAVFIWTNNINQARAEIYYVKALNSIKTADCQGVINNMEKVMALSPNSGYYRENYLFLILNCFSLTKNQSEKKQLNDYLFKRIKLAGEKKSYGLEHNLARVYVSLGFYSEAEKIFNDLIANFPYFPELYEDLAKQKMAQADFAGAVEIYNQALKVLPPLDHPYLNEPHRRQISDIAVRLYEGAGQAYFKVKNYEVALDYYKKGLKLDPFRATLYKSLADVYYIQGQLERAISWNQRGLMLNPADYHWPLALSLLYRDKKDLAEARKYLNQALKLAPENQELERYYEELNK